MKKVIQSTGLQIIAIVVLSLIGGDQLFAQTFPTPGFTLPAGKTIIITYDVDVNSNACPTSTVPGGDISNQSTVSGSNFSTVQTDDPDIIGASNPTLTPFSSLSLGDLVYKDVNRNGVFDAGDTGIDGVALNLYLDNGDGVLTVADGAPVATATTATVMAQAGIYSFTVCPGNYIVEVAASNFNVGGALYDNGFMAALVSSPVGGAMDPDNDVNNDDNGDPVAGFGVASQAIMLSYGGEPINDGDADNNTNLSLDFGFKTPTTVSINDVTMNEGTGGAPTAFNFTVTRNDAAEAFSITVNTADGTAVSPSDFTAISGGTVAFTAGGALTQTVTVLVNQDNVVEANETFTVLLSGAPGGVTITDGSGLGTITNDDAAVVTLTPMVGVTLPEGNAGTTAFVFTATLNNPVQGGFTLPYTTNDGTATVADADYMDNDGTLTFTGNSGEAKLITVLVNGDLKVEANETFTVALGAITGAPAGVTTAGSPQTGTINNDDAATVSIAANVSQSESTTPQVFSVTLSNPVDVAVTVVFSTSDGTATTADNDYTGIAGQTVTFAAGTTTAQSVNVTIINDSKVEADEVYNASIGTLAAGGRNVSLGTAARTGTITNDDSAILAITAVTAQDEGNTGTTPYVFTVTLNNAVQGGFSLAYTTNNGTATTPSDYVDNDGPALVFTGTANEMKTITVLINGDNVVEADETFTVALGAISGTTSGASINIAGSPKMATIVNDEIDWGDGPDTLPTLSIYNGARHKTVLGFQLGATIDGDPDGQGTGGSSNNLANGDDTDADGDDEDGVTLPSVFITGTTATITVNASQPGKLDAFMDFNWNRDLSDAGEKIFNNVALVAGDNVLTFNVPSNAVVGSSFLRFRFSSAGGLSNSGLAPDGEVEDYRTNIVSNQFSVDNPSVTEGNAGTTNLTFTISRTTNTTASSVNYTVSAGTATLVSDYASNPSGTLNFTAGGALSQTVTVTVNGDMVVENNETVILTLSNPVNGGIGVNPGTGTITNDDLATLTFAGGTSHAEGGIPFTFTANIDKAVQGGFTIAYNTNNGTATLADNDYVDNDGTLTFSGAANETQTFVVNSVQDNKVELDETFTTALGASVGGTSAVQIAAITVTGSPQTGTITNDDGAIVALTGSVSQLEATTPQTFTVTLSNPVDVNVTVQFSTANNTASTADNDYVGIASQTVTFLAGTTTSQSVPVTINSDNKVEGDELYNVNIGTLAAGGRNVALGTADATGTILNDDNATVTLSGGTSVTEGNTGQTPVVFTATLNNPVQGGFTANYTTNDGTATTADNDYMDNDGSVAFAGTMGESHPITVQVNGDLNIEADETFTVAINSLGFVTIVNPASVTIVGSPQTATIINDEKDWGDAPGAAQSGFAGSYPTTLAQDGARHAATLNGLHLGATIDADLDGQPNATATGDGADEDGVTLPSAIVLNTTANITVNASGPGFLQAWVDFNRDGDWNDMGEQVFTDQALVAGNNALSFAVPAGASVGTSFARFRFCNSMGIGVSGLAPEGEVEDYQINIVNTQFSINDISVLEGNAGTTNLTFTITRTVNANACSVDYAITGGTATSGSDYVPFASGTANFTAGGSLIQTITVLVNGDNTVELDETVFMTLSNPVNASILDGDGIGTIQNDDAAVITITSPSIIEGDGGTTNLVFTINMSNPSDANVDLNYFTVDGTATTANNDYTLTNGTHTFTAGQISKTVSVPIIGDCSIEPNETFIVRLGSLSANGRDVTFSGGGAQLDGTGTITNDDALPVITCPANITMNAEPGVCNATVTVTLPTTSSLCGSSTLTFRYRTVDAMNTPTGAYTAPIPSASNSVNFAVGRYEVEWQVTDGSGSSVCSFFIEVVDNQPPVANCFPLYTLNLNAGGTGTLMPANLNNNSTDNCGITTQTVSPVSLSCANVGPITGTLTVGDAAGNMTSCTSQVDVIASAVCPPPAIGNAGGPNIADPCTCLGNGRFAEEVVIGPANPGQMWRVQGTSLINPNTNQPYLPNTLFTEVPVGGGQSIYVLQGIHLDGVGYSLNATSLYYPNVVLSISNTCYYPHPVITGPDGDFCLNSPDATFTGTAVGISGTGQFYLNGSPVTTIESPANSGNWVTTLDFSALGIGTYNLVFEFNAGNPAGLLSPPNVGCISTVNRFINVVVTPSNLVCNDHVTISLDQSCSLVLNPDDILEGTYFCYDDYKVEIDRTLPLGNGPWQPGILGPGDVHRTFGVRVTHLVSGNSCWGTLTIEDKLAPIIECPCSANTDNTCTYTCADKDGILNGSIATPIPVAVDGCEGPITTVVNGPNVPGANLYKTDTYFDGGQCGTARIERTWTAKDSWGNSAQCTQIFYLEPYTLEDVDFPDDVTISCAGCGVTAGTLPCVTGVPTVDGFDADGLYEIIQYNGNCGVLSEGICNLGAQYTDIRIDICSGTFKILRHWVVLDWCTNTTSVHDQLIKVVDDQGPVIETPADMTVSTNPSQCCANVNLPDVIVEDACSATANISAMVVVYDQYLEDQVIATYTVNGNTLTTFPGNNFWDCDTLGNYGTTPCLPIGHHQVMYMAEDVCGNTSVTSFWLTVVDDVPPVATCTQFTTVAIGPDDPTDCYEPGGTCEFAGVAWVPASAFNQGSQDNCNGIGFTVRRMAPYSDCINGLSSLCDGYEYNVATAENDSIKFYCCEVGTTQTVILRVYQLDINGNWDYYRNDDGTPLTDPDGNIQYIYNECMVNVEVQDKIKPICQPPAHVTVSCENFDPTLWAYGYPSVSDNCCLDETPPTSANPGGVSGIPAGTSAIPGVCGATQKTYYTGFLNANFDTTCNKGVIIRRFTAWDCQGQSSSCTQRVTVTNNQAYTVQFPADKLVNCVTTPVFGAPIITNDEGCELIGTSYNDVVFTVVPDACYKIERTWTIINWCTYNPDLPCTAVTRNPVSPTTGLAPSKTYNVTSENCVTYKQIIKVIDQTPPTVACQDIDTCDYSTNNVRYWNDGLNWWDNGTMQHDLCEKETEIAVTAEDFCDTLSPTGGLRFRYLLFLDLDGDGIMETVVSSADLNTRPVGQVRYGNYQNLNYGGGSLWSFDNNSNASQRYRFDIEQTATGARIIWRNNSGTKLPELAHGRHKIKWIAEDGCGNEAVCEKTFEIKDCKPPVVACANVNINLMVGGMATLWATDFFLYGDDNCTPANILNPTLAVIRADENPGNTYPGGAPQNQNVVVTCADQGTNVPVQIWLIDAAGNADFCLAYVNVQGNIVGCPNNAMATVAGSINTETPVAIENVSVEINTPGATATQLINATYAFTNVPFGADVTITPTKDENPLNGVTTYDLVLISKHILGLEPLTTPYKMIAADANRSGSITTFDIVEFRKLILGIYNELPANTSWRFVEKAYTFPNPSNPFQAQFPENISISNLMVNHLNEDFVGVKIGDVNNTVIANELQSVDDRTSATMLFDVEDRTVKAGEVFTVNFKGAERVQGYQFTMNFNGLEVQDITPGADMKLENFGVFQDAITTSVNGAANEFAVTFRATKAGLISTMLGVSSRITKAEAYSQSNDRMDVAFRFNTGNTSTISGVGFELYQNQPNPFVNKTFIGFHLPEATSATLRIYDETGRMIFTQNGDFAKGYNSFAIDRQLISTTGVLYYTVETTTGSATKKMIQSK